MKRAVITSATFQSYTEFKSIFQVVRVSSLSLTNKFMAYEPENATEEWIKMNIIEAINTKLPDFRTSIYAPSVDRNGNIAFVKGARPAVGYHANWWYDRIKVLISGMNPRLGNKLQYAAYMGILIRTLVEEEGYSVRDAWKAICDDSRVLIVDDGTERAKGVFKNTGVKQIGKWCDLTICYKLLKRDIAPGLLLAGGSEIYKDSKFCLADFIMVFAFNGNFTNATAWIVTDV